MTKNEPGRELRLVHQRLRDHGSQTTDDESWTCPVPEHGDRTPSLTVRAGESKPVVLHCFAGCEPDAVLGALDLTWGDLSRKPPKRAVMTDVYCDESGTELFKVVRREDVYGAKDFLLAARKDGKWVSSKGCMTGVRRVLWETPNLRRVIDRSHGRATVFVVEGEKSAHAMKAYIAGLPPRQRFHTVATTAPQGAGKSFEAFVPSLSGAGRVIVVADNDDAGRNHAAEVVRTLKARGIRARAVRSATDGTKDDIVEHLGAGHGLAELRPVIVTDEPGDTAARASDWEPVPIASIPAEDTGSAPTLFVRDDGVALLYPGKVHSLHGESESGKSWVAQTAVATTVQAGGTALYVDFESDQASVLERFVELGLSAAALARIDYLNPDSSNEEDGAWAAVLRERTYTIAVVDGVTDGMAAFGLKINENDDVAKFHHALPKPLAQRTGAAVVLVDHVVKSQDGRGRFAIGGQHKMAALDGAAFTVDVVHTLGRGKRGELNLRVGKDRPGYLRQHAHAEASSDRTQHMASFVLDATGDALTWSLTAEKAKLLRTTRASGPSDDDRVLAWLIAQDPDAWFSTNKVKHGVGGDHKRIPPALGALLVSGRIEQQKGQGRGGGQEWRAARNLGELG